MKKKKMALSTLIFDYLNFKVNLSFSKPLTGVDEKVRTFF